MYTLVHPTKTGGIAFGTHLQRYPQIQTRFLGHEEKCTLKNNPIVTLREPVDRFVSQYNFWKYGSEYKGCTRKKYFQESVKEYIRFIQKDSPKLREKFTGRHHYAPQSRWVPPECYPGTIVVRYDRDLTPKVRDLLRYLGVPWDHGRILPINVSLKKETVALDAEDLAWIRDYYRADFELWDLVNQSPERFKHVI